MHISAPHIYGTILEALDLTQAPAGSTFLNIGSGTGYLTCLVAQIMGPHTTVYSVELQDEALRHCQQAVNKWKESRGPVARMEFLQGNGLWMDAAQGEARMGFDRIYVGAALETEDLEPIANLLRPNGVLVCPGKCCWRLQMDVCCSFKSIAHTTFSVNDELVKATRLAHSEKPTKITFLHIPRSFRGHPPLLNGDFSTEIISSVRFTAMIEPTSSCLPLVIPSRIWEPSLHPYYSETFRAACREILLCANADPSRHSNVVTSLPRALWLEVFSYTDRDWFEPPLSEEDRLRNRLRQLEASLKQTEQAKRDIEKQLRVAHSERDMYRQMARHMQQILGSSRLHDLLEDPSALAAAMYDSDSVESEQRMDDDEDDEIMEEDVLEAVPLSSHSVRRAHRTVSIGSEHA